MTSLEGLSIPVPDNFEVDITDPLLFAACGVSLPDMCETGSDITPGCSSDTGILAFLMAGAETNPGCYSPLIKLVREEDKEKELSTTSTEISLVSNIIYKYRTVAAAFSYNRSVKMIVQEN